METAITEARYQDGKPILIRYADDLVILHPNKEELQKAAATLTTWLAEIGLHLHPTKTRITHTLTPYEGNVGFDFVGFSIRQFSVGKTHTGKNPHGKALGFKTSIVPSKETIKRHMGEIKHLLREHRTAPQEKVIRRLNPVIRGWTNYHKWVICSKAFHTCDYTLFWQLASWSHARHPGKGKRQTSRKYQINLEKTSRFGTYIKDQEGTQKPLYLRLHTDTHSQDHIKVRGRASPYDGNLIYWTKRLQQHPLMGYEKAKLLTLQKGQCPRCGLYFQEGDILETDHIIPTALGGKKRPEQQMGVPSPLPC